jgi:hypothetical protein
VTTPLALTTELLERVGLERPALVCLAATAPSGMAHTRYLCKRLRGQFPDIKILVCRFGTLAHRQTKPQRLVEAGADSVSTTLLETRQTLASFLPVLARIQKELDKSGPLRRGDAPEPLPRGRADSLRRGGESARVADSSKK